VPFAADGSWDVPAMTSTLQQSSPRLALLIPDFNNPTGTLIRSEQRQQVLAAAHRAGTRVVVDESFVDLDLSATDPELPDAEQPDQQAPMAELGADVLSVGSMSKPVWGGLRAGWVRADAETVTRLAIVRARADMSGSVLDQLLACELLADYQPLIAGRRAELRTRRDALLAALAAKLPQWSPSWPAGGLSTWVRLDAPASAALTHRAEQLGVLLTPGSRFTVGASLERYLRIPFALPADVLTDAVDRIGEAWQELDRQPARRVDAGLLIPT
jgi:DNA-binding transcriptional MocR family regulator